MITVVGEALIDLVVGHDGRIDAQPGGGPFNTARTLGRLGLAPAFLGRLSQDGFGRMLRDRLDQDAVTLGVPELADAPTIERLIASDLPPDTLVMIDPNCRPAAITDRSAYLARLARILRRADVVKVSVEDLAYLAPGVPARAAAAALLEQGPALVLVTDGPRPALALLPGQDISADVPVVKVVDTIGAGDAFGGAFLAWWSGQELTKSDLHRPGPVREALQAAVEVAALTCTRPGAEPPWLAEVRGRPGWRSIARTERETRTTVR